MSKIWKRFVIALSLTLFLLGAAQASPREELGRCMGALATLRTSDKAALAVFERARDTLRSNGIVFKLSPEEAHDLYASMLHSYFTRHPADRDSSRKIGWSLGDGMKTMDDYVEKENYLSLAEFIENCEDARKNFE